MHSEHARTADRPASETGSGGRERLDVEVLYRTHMKRVYRYHLVRTGNAADAEDLTSQTFLAALEGLESYRGQGSVAGWLLGIASHKLADLYRRRRPDLPLEAAETAGQPDPWPEDQVARRLEIAAVARALKVLPPVQAEALSLRIFGGLSAAEAARVMGKSEAAVKMAVHRGLRTLQAELAFDWEVSL